MRVLELDERRGRLQVIIETPEDLYYLSMILRKGDLVYAWTFRQLRVERELGSEKGERVRVYVGIELEKIGYSKFTKTMRLTGRVVEAPEDLHIKGSFHTLSIGVGDEVTIIRKEGLGYFDKEILSRATSIIRRVLAISIGDDEVSIGVLSPIGVELKGSFPYYPRRTDKDASIRESVLPVLKEHLEVVRSAYDPANYDEILVLTTERLVEAVKETLESLGIKARIIKVSEGGEAGIYELLRRQDLRHLFTEIRSLAEAQEANALIEELLKGSQRVIVGIENVERVTEWGVVEKLIVLDELFFDEATRERIFNIISRLQNSKFLIVDGESETGRVLKRLGGIVARTFYTLPAAEAL